MLTKNDLQAIDGLITSRLDQKLKPVKDAVSGIEDKVSGIEDKVSGIEDKVSGIEDKVSGIEDKVSGIEKDVKTVKKGLTQVRRDQKTMLNLLDVEQMQLRKRVKRIEAHIGLS